MKWIALSFETPPCGIWVFIFINNRIGIARHFNGVWSPKKIRVYGGVSSSVVENIPEYWYPMPNTILSKENIES